MSIQNNNQTGTRNFSELHTLYYDRLLKGITVQFKDRAMSEDVTAQAFVTAYEKRHSFRGESSFYTWIYTIASNAAIQQVSRRRTVSLETFADTLPQEFSGRDFLAETLEQVDCRAKLREAVRLVPITCRQVMFDHIVRGRSVKSIASSRRIPLGTVLSRIHSAKRYLRAAWGL